MDIFHSDLYFSWNGFLHYQFTEYIIICSCAYSSLDRMCGCIVCFFKSFCFISLFPVISHFVCTTKQALKNALLMTFGHLPYTLMMLALAGLLLFLCSSSSKLFAMIVVLSGICGFSVVSFVYSIMFDRIFQKYESET